MSTELVALLVVDPTHVFPPPASVGYDGGFNHQRDDAISEPALDEQWVQRERRIRRFVIASLPGRRPVNPNVRPLTRLPVIDSTEQMMQCFGARRKHGGFMRHKIEMTLPNGTVATMIGGILSGEGVITVAEKTYQIARSVMSDEMRGVADYMLGGSFMGLTSARLYDLEQERSYMLRQRRIWSATLDLFENENQVGEFRSNCLQGRYRIVVNHGVPTKMVLLCVWVVMVRMAFAA